MVQKAYHCSIIIDKDWKRKLWISDREKKYLKINGGRYTKKEKRKKEKKKKKRKKEKGGKLTD